MDNTEIWKDISGFEGMYKISNLGNIKSFKRKITKILKHATDTAGYKYVCLSGKNYSIHRLVACYFIPNPENKPEVNHKDGDKANYSIDNLDWNTVSENQIHAYKTGLQKRKPHGENPKAKKVINTMTNEIYDSASLAYVFTIYKYVTFISMLNGNRINKTIFEYVK